MKTAESIEHQEARKAVDKESKTPRSSSQFSEPVSEARRRSLANLKPFPTGVSGNPGDVPKHDGAAELSRAVIAGNQELIYKAFVKALSKGNAYAFHVLSDRGYGKVKETRHVELSRFDGIPTEDLEAQVKQLEAELRKAGYVFTSPHDNSEVQPQLLPPADETKPN